MPRSVRDSRLDTRSARLRLPASKHPVWRHLTRTRHLGYRRNQGAGTWYARLYAEGRYRVHRLGQADDRVEADGAEVLSYDQAISEAHRWFEAAAVAAHVYTVRNAVEDYRDYLRSEQKPSAGNVGWLLRKHLPRHVSICPGTEVALGDVRVSELTPQLLRDWRTGFLDAGLSRSTANNHLAVLKAALSRAYQDRPDLVPSDHAWRRVRPLKNAIQARVGYFSVEESSRLMAACEPDFRELVQAALLTGCRHGELRRLDVGDYHRVAGRPWVNVRQSKSGRGRKVFLDDQGEGLFEQATAGREPEEPMFLSSMVTGVLFAVASREGWPSVQRIGSIKQSLECFGHRTRELSAERLAFLEGLSGLSRSELLSEDWRRWRRQSQIRRMRQAAESQGLRIKNFHALRHTYASLLVQAGVPLKFVAEQLGHSSIRMVEMHYGHLAPSVVAQAISAHMPRYDVGGAVAQGHGA